MRIETVGTYVVDRGYVTVTVEPLRSGNWAVFKNGFVSPGERWGQHLEAEFRTLHAAKGFAEFEVMARGGSIGQTGDALLCGRLGWADFERLRLDTRSRKPKRFVAVRCEPGAG